jgi:hypothetical protein
MPNEVRAMTLLETPRSRAIVVAAALAVVAIFCLLFALQVVQAHAAKRAILSEQDRLYTQLASGTDSHAAATPVLVELFTSEGCSSCPPADALLARLLKDQPVPAANILVLEEHVDYWDSLGWHDRFSSHQFTERQTAYAQRLRVGDPYTPQMIVDGVDQFVGNDSAHALRAIAQAARAPKLAFTLSAVTFDGGHLAGAVSVALPVAPRPTPAHDAALYAAVVESMASTQVLRGENSGRTLNHVSVVRAMQRIGSLADATSAPLKFSLAAPQDASAANLRVIVFVQRDGQGAILGAAASPSSPASLTAR